MRLQARAPSSPERRRRLRFGAGRRWGASGSSLDGTLRAPSLADRPSRFAVVPVVGADLGLAFALGWGWLVVGWLGGVWILLWCLLDGLGGFGGLGFLGGRTVRWLGFLTSALRITAGMRCCAATLRCWCASLPTMWKRVSRVLVRPMPVLDASLVSAWILRCSMLLCVPLRPKVLGSPERPARYRSSSKPCWAPDGGLASSSSELTLRR